MKFFIVSNRIFDVGLKPMEFSVYCYLLRCKDNKTATCFPSRGDIAKKCQISLRSVDKSLNRLCELKLITKQHRFVLDKCGQPEGQSSNLYYVSELPSV